MPAARIELPSGLWSGHYEQYGAHHPQRMTLEFADGLIRGDGQDALGTFAIEGEYRLADSEVRMGWIKTYEGAHSVLYLCTKAGSGEITGNWQVYEARGSFALAWESRSSEAGVSR